MDFKSDFLFVEGTTFGLLSKKGELLSRESLHYLKRAAKRSGANTLLLPIYAVQENAQSTKVDYKSSYTPSEFEIENFIDFAHQSSLRVLLIPSVKILNGTSSEFIDFFDDGVSPEPTWKSFFESYGEFVLMLAKIAQTTGTSMFSVGNGFTKSERRVEEWRSLVKKVREEYSGFVTYKTDRNINELSKWIDVLDFVTVGGKGEISEEKFVKIEKTFETLKKPFIYVDTDVKKIDKLQNDKNYYVCSFLPMLKKSPLCCGGAKEGEK